LAIEGTLADGTLPLAKKLKYVCWNLAPWLCRQANFGLSLGALERQQRRLRLPPADSMQAGYVSSTLKAALANPENEAAALQAGGFEKALAALKNIAPQFMARPGRANQPMLKAYLQLEKEAESKGIEVFFVVCPRNNIQNLHSIEGVFAKLPVVHKVDFESMPLHANLYSKETSTDARHLNDHGARLMTAELANYIFAH
jgi:hypothetical protein